MGAAWWAVGPPVGNIDLCCFSRYPITPNLEIFGSHNFATTGTARRWRACHKGSVPLEKKQAAVNTTIGKIRFVLNTGPE